MITYCIQLETPITFFIAGDIGKYEWGECRMLVDECRRVSI